VSSLVGGVYYPVAILPDWLQAVSALLPITYALRAMRLALLQGASVEQILPELLALAGSPSFLMPLSLAAFRLGRAPRQSRTAGPTYTDSSDSPDPKGLQETLRVWLSPPAAPDAPAPQTSQSHPHVLPAARSPRFAFPTASPQSARLKSASKKPRISASWPSGRRQAGRARGRR